MNLLISRDRLWVLLEIALPIAGVIILFLSGIFPLENLLTSAPQNLTASVAASDVASLTNQERISNGLPPLSVNPLLAQAAQLKADDMAKNAYYAHTGPDGKTMLDWMSEVGYHYLNAGENLVIDRTTAKQAVDAWMNSPDHRANILRPQFTEIGVGVAEGEYQGVQTIFVAQEFGTPYPSSATISASAKTVKATTPAAQPKPVVVVTPAPVLKTAPPSSIAVVPVVPAPSAIPHVSTLAAKKTTASPSLSLSTTSAIISSSTVATTSLAEQGSSTISYTLAPEFYTPVTLSDQQDALNSAQFAAPQAASVSRLSVLVREIKAYLSHIF